MGIQRLSASKQPRSGKKVFFATTSSSWVTALSVNGRGRLSQLLAFAAASTTIEIKVTIDGTVIINPTFTNSQNWIGPITSLATGIGFMPFDLEFQSSLLIEMRLTSGTTSSNVNIAYEVE